MNAWFETSHFRVVTVSIKQSSLRDEKKLKIHATTLSEKYDQLDLIIESLLWEPNNYSVPILLFYYNIQSQRAVELLSHYYHRSGVWQLATGRPRCQDQIGQVQTVDNFPALTNPASHTIARDPISDDPLKGLDHV